MKGKKENLIKILLLEDDVTLSDIISEFLTEQGYDVVCAYDGDEAIDRGYEEPFDLFLLDVKVPCQNGFDVLRHLRQEGKESPAIFVTSLSSVDDLSQAYDAGCDDFLRKPFELQELLLRIKALLKRSFYHKASEKIDLGDGIIFDINQSRLYKEDQEIILARKEVKILKVLLAHQNSVVSIEQIIESAWDYDDDVSEESLRTHIKNLRKHLGKDRIINIRGQGYQIALS